ncbi:MAG: hypothetical protein NWR64_00215, partial [Haliea sp.]|nr:hypothetical protein [Haliea sp.]
MQAKLSNRWEQRMLLGIIALLIVGCSDKSSSPEITSPPEPEPAATNILFIVLDDVGMDQMEIFGYGGETPPSTPT